MKLLDSSRDLAAIVSTVTETMLGIKFSPADDKTHEAKHLWRNASLSLIGKLPLVVAVSADEQSCRALGAAMFSTPPEQVDDGMVEDSLCELVNMTAGVLKRSMGVDQALGLPKIQAATAIFGSSPGGHWKQHYLKAGDLNLVLSIATPAV